MEPRQVEPLCSAVILAGGRSSRMHGRNKALLTVGGQSLLERLIAVFQSSMQEILLVTREPELYTGYPLRIVRDIYSVRSSLTGIHAGLKQTRADYALVVPCDAPLLQPAVVRMLIQAIEPGVDVVIPIINDFYEPLCAIYSKQCLNPIENQLDRGDYKITRFFDAVHIKPIPEAQIKTVDPQLQSFINVNTPEAFEELKRLLG